MTSSTIAERIILIRLVYATVWHGVADRSSPEHAAVLHMLETALDAELASASRPQRQTIERHVARAVLTLMAPHIAAGESCAKFGLAVFYAIRTLIDEGAYDLADGPFSDAMDAVLHEDGTVTEFANLPLMDRSAQKQARRLVIAMRSLGYFPEMVAA